MLQDFNYKSLISRDFGFQKAEELRYEMKRALRKGDDHAKMLALLIVQDACLEHNGISPKATNMLLSVCKAILSVQYIERIKVKPTNTSEKQTNETKEHYWGLAYNKYAPPS